MNIGLNIYLQFRNDTAIGNADKNENVLEETPSKEPATAKKSGKKGKRLKKKSRQLIILQRLNKLAEQYKNDEKKYNMFVDRIDKWFADNLNKMMRLFKELDSEDVGELTYEQFKAGMIDYNIPCNLIELHLLCTLLDTDGNLGIDFNEFDKGIRYFRVVEAESSPYRESDREIKLLETNERIYINCTLTLVTFEDHKDFRGHFPPTTITTNMYVANLIEMIKTEKRYCTNELHIYKDNTRSLEALLPDNKTLEELGYKGGSYYQPKQLHFYYDFDPIDVMCPLIFD